ncbi:MAG TPA: RagB/SusD family nutrient uptake outer membrane protein [Cytophagales bacterium]|nr:RagB/SusD family nutrient uptake outer membrane protein [Cytophagales bacterium]
MNFKKHIYRLLVLTVVLSSCADLEEKPHGITNTISFYKTEADANAALIYAYSVLPEVGYYSRMYYVVTELPTENLTMKGDAGIGNTELDQLRMTSTNTDIGNIWGYMYNAILRANAVIANVPQIAVMSEASRNQVIGEGYFLRGLHYFNLVRMFGEVPVRTEPLTNVDQIPKAKSTIKEVYDLIISDLQKAEELMSAEENLEGRANKIAAQALLSKVYLHLASSGESASPGYDFVTSPEEMYTNAKTYSGKVVNEQSVFGFTESLREIWDIEKYKVPSAVTEHIFDAAVDRNGAAEGNYSKLPNMFLPAIGFNMILDDGINIGQGWNHFQTEPAIYNFYADNDKRKTELIVSSVKDDKGVERTLNINDWSRPFSRKYIDPKRIGDASSANSPVIRYSDILLVYAEANGPTPEGYAAINRIRNRAGIGDLTTGLSVPDFRQAVVEERARELAFEGHRLFDLRRTNSVEKILVDKYGKTITSGGYFFLIPQKELDTNPLMK